MEIPKSRKQNNGPCVICGVRDPEIKYQKFTEDAKEKASRNNNLDLTWELNITQFCQKM
ncbi:5679_t:CDS:2 [Entrophospora sp. SA101]|nr:5679_t:CDS:2 [Entrophospora sp. SA101]